MEELGDEPKLAARQAMDSSKEPLVFHLEHWVIAAKRLHRLVKVQRKKGDPMLDAESSAGLALISRVIFEPTKMIVVRFWGWHHRYLTRSTPSLLQR